MYVRIRSWHRVKIVTRGSSYITLCGRSAPREALTTAELGAEKSCESCLRIMARQDA